MPAPARCGRFVLRSAEAVAQRSWVGISAGLVGAALVAGTAWLAVSPPEGRFHAVMVAIWWLCSLVRLWVIISNRHSVRTAVLPLRRNRVAPLL